jgi:hypothetical protein
VTAQARNIRGRLWRVACRAGYRRGMAIARKSRPIQPARRPSALEAYAGQWVAVKDGVVIAHAPNSRDVVRQMRLMGPAAEGAVLQRAAQPDEALAVGLG